MKRFVIGDIHGRFEALKKVLKKCKFNYKKDKLIVLGDVVDGGPRTYEVVEELLKIKNRIYLVGNHDEWFMNHIKNGWAEEIWIQQGGANTLKSYGADVKEADSVSDESLIDTSDLRIPVTHQHFFNRGKYWHIEDNILCVNAGIHPKISKIESQSKFDLVWDRNLINYALTHNVPGYKHVYVGHTTTQTYGGNPLIKNCYEPLTFHNLTMMDTGAGWNGKLSIMDIDTRKFWQSGLLYPTGR